MQQVQTPLVEQTPLLLTYVMGGYDQVNTKQPKARDVLLRQIQFGWVTPPQKAFNAHKLACSNIISCDVWDTGVNWDQTHHSAEQAVHALHMTG